MRSMSRAMGLAQPEEIIQAFVDDAEPMFRLLEEAVRQGIHPEFAQRLLAAFPFVLAEQPVKPEIQKNGLPMHAPLSEHEMAVLQLIAAGLSNKEIAQRLFISLRTVKYYTTSIYTKMDVNGRAHAAVRAKELGLLK